MSALPNAEARTARRGRRLTLLVLLCGDSRQAIPSAIDGCGRPIRKYKNQVQAQGADGRFLGFCISPQVRQNQADRLLAVLLFRRLRPCAAALGAGWIRKSSSFFPDLSSAVSQRGCFPRPAQVSDGRAGFLYFGKTCGYGRRAWLTFLMLAAVFWPSSRNFCSSAACSEDILRASTETTSS
jgi:hypothetical protein